MRIAFLIYSLEKAGGSERVTANIANKLTLLGYEISIVTLTGNSSFFDLANTINNFSVDNEHGMLRKGRALVKFFNEKKFDCIISVSIGKLSLYLAGLSFFFKNKSRLIASEHLALTHSSRLSIAIKKYIYKRFSKVVVLTNSDLQLLKSYKLKNVVRISNASSYFPDIDSINKILKRKKVILAAGRLEYQKGFDLLIKAWAAVYQEFPDWELKIIGGGSLENSLNNLRQTLIKNDKACQILPFTNKMEEYYNNSQVFALSSRFEGFPMVMIEALSYGCPMISFDCETGPREIIRDGETGLLVEAGNIDDFSNKLRQLLNNESLRDKFFKNQLFERDIYSIDNIIKQWRKILADEA